jgi:hypothetical protein
MVIIQDGEKYYTRERREDAVAFENACEGCCFSVAKECAKPAYFGMHMPCSIYYKRSSMDQEQKRIKGYFIFKEVDPIHADLEQVRQRELYKEDY